MPEIKDNYADVFCEVLKAGLWNKVPEVVLSVAEMRSIWTDSIKQAVSGLVAQSFMNTKSVHPRTAEMLQKRLIGIAATNFRQTHLLADSVKALRAEGMDPVLLKGLGVASFYHQPLLRECGDIDLYVGRENYRKAFDTLVGSLPEVQETDFSLKEKHSHVVVKGIPVELHQYSDLLPRKYDPAYQDISDKCLSGGFVPMRFDDVDVLTPEPTFNAFFIFNHLWRHFIAVGVGFRQICDFVMVLHAQKGDIDSGRLYGMLERLDLVKPWRVFGWIAVNMLGLPEEEMPFYDPSIEKTAVKVVGMVMKEGNFGHEREDRWSESGHRLKDKAKVFLVSTWRYLKVFPMFGRLAWHEYKMRINSYL